MEPKASKIIQKEKERQEEILSTERFYEKYKDNEKINFHKQSLINLKEYLEKMLKPISDMEDALNDEFGGSSTPETDQLKEDIQELNKMIERYN